MDPTLVVPETVRSAPYCITVFIAGLCTPVGVWGVVFLAKYVRRGYRLGGGVVGGGE